MGQIGSYNSFLKKNSDDNIILNGSSKSQILESVGAELIVEEGVGVVYIKSITESLCYVTIPNSVDVPTINIVLEAGAGNTLVFDSSSTQQFYPANSFINSPEASGTSRAFSLFKIEKGVWLISKVTTYTP